MRRVCSGILEVDSIESVSFSLNSVTISIKLRTDFPRFQNLPYPEPLPPPDGPATTGSGGRRAW